MTKEEFKSLFDEYFDSVRSYLFYRGAEKELASDIAQDVFLRMWEKQPDGDRKTLTGLLYKMAGDMFITRYRRDRLESEYRISISYEKYAQSPEDQFQYKELQEKYAKALSVMDEKQRTVFMMARMEGLKYYEIADRLELSIKAVEKRMSFALSILRKYLQT